eukprot:scaffold846_cov168-Amphora_coffeaeformis.AAC.14
MSSPCVPDNEPAKGFEANHDVERDMAVSPIAKADIVVTPIGPDPLTWVDSNDPESVRENSTKVEELPKKGVGCMHGCLRDVHCRHIFLYFGIIAFIVVWIIKRQQHASCDETDWRSHCGYDSFWSGGLPAIPLVVVYLLFLLEFTCSSTNQYLRKTESIPDALAFFDKLYRTKPTLSLSMECYHYRTVTYEDSKGRKRTKREKVTTWRGTEHVTIVAWEDVTSHRLDQPRLSEYQLTKVRISKVFTADKNYERQKASFVNQNRHRDTHYNLFVNFNLKGFCPRLLTYVHYDGIPYLFGWDVVVLCHLLVIPALPYRIWLSSISGKQDTTIHKKLQTR